MIELWILDYDYDNDNDNDNDNDSEPFQTIYTDPLR